MPAAQAISSKVGDFVACFNIVVSLYHFNEFVKQSFESLSEQTGNGDNVAEPSNPVDSVDTSVVPEA